MKTHLSGELKDPERALSAAAGDAVRGAGLEVSRTTISTGEHDVYVETDTKGPEAVVLYLDRRAKTVEIETKGFGGKAGDVARTVRAALKLELGPLVGGAAAPLDDVSTR